MSFYQPQKPLYLVGPSCVTGLKKVTNEDFANWIGSKIKPSLLEKRTGIHTRYWASKEQAVTDLGFESVSQLLESTPHALDNLASLIFSTISSDYPVPPSAPILQDKLLLKNIGSFDLAAACAGFVTGLITAAQSASGFQKDVLLCSSEIRSKFINPKDFQTAVLFGDGASSCVVSNNSEGANFEFISGQLFSDGSVADIISIPHGGSRTPFNEVENDYYPYLKMKDGAELFIKALSGMAQSSTELLSNSGFSLNDIDWVVPHQANLHMIQGLIRKLGFPDERTVQTVKKYGNTSGASVGMALHELRTKYPVKSGDKVLLISAGGGGLSANAILKCL